MSAERTAPGMDGRPAPAPHEIDPNTVYTLPSATEALGTARDCLPREIRLGRLQARRRGGRYYILGAWLLDWIRTGAAHRRWEQREGPEPAGAGGNGRRVKPR